MIENVKNYIQAPLILVGIIITIFVIDFIIPIDFILFGIYPRSLTGLLGIPFSPFLHGNLPHLLSNIFPLLLLGMLVRSSGHAHFLKSTTILIGLSGLFTWLLSANPVVGASGLVFAYWTYIITSAVMERTLRTLLIAGITLLLYGSLIFSLASFHEGVSWAGHFSGAVAGVILGILDPLHSEEESKLSFS